MIKVLAQAIEKVKALPEERQRYAAEVLEQIAAGADQVYQLTEEERAVLEPELAAAKRGEFATEQEVDEVLNKPWA